MVYAQGDALHHLSSLSLTKPLKKPVREIMKRYQLADRDKTFEVQTKVEELKENMQDNGRRILETHHNLENLEQRTDNMSRQADQFLKQVLSISVLEQDQELRHNLDLLVPPVFSFSCLVGSIV